MTLQPEFKIAVLPVDIVPCDKAANIEAVESLMSGVSSDTDLVVLPELFSTGFVSKPDVLREIAEPNSGLTVDRLHNLARRYNVAVAGTFLALTVGQLYNRAFFIEPSGEETFYDKRHLFSLSSEAKWLTAGNTEPFVVRFRGWNISVVVCYDLRFPAWCRNAECKYDLLVVPSNWPNSRAYAWTHLLKARAIENQTYVVGANRVGADKFGDYSGMSLVLDFMGHEIVAASADEPQMLSAILNHDVLDAARQSFPVWKDGDCFDLRM